MKKIYGNTDGLKANQLRHLEKLNSRRVPIQMLISPELCRDMCRISHETRRQIGLLINRKGRIVCVVAGSPHQIVIPDTPDYRTLPGRLKGLRCVHTHLKGERLTQDDLTDLLLLRLDVMAAIGMNDQGMPAKVHAGHILPGEDERDLYRLIPPMNPWEMDIDCLSVIRALETEIDRTQTLLKADRGKERALLVSVTTSPRNRALDSLDELRELTRSAGIVIADTILQLRKKTDGRFLMGLGKLQDLSVLALRKAVSLIIFDQDLNPSQIRSLTDRIDLKIIDRTQLILDIFSQRARTREGKLQVELAQLKYMLPRLVTKNTAMSRLTGGIGGRGPGETKLEINRRRARQRIAWLEKQTSHVRKHRKQQRVRRYKKGLPIISIVGYTNAGKSTLLNTLTRSRVKAENRLFATLDPSSRRLKFPEDMEVIITDTVGFIRDLPKDLMAAFRATLEELESADLLLHVVDIGNPRFKAQIRSVDGILSDLSLSHIPCIRVLNKQDLLTPDTLNNRVGTFGGIAVSALDRKSLLPLIDEIIRTIKPRTIRS